jgi:hypothetical protein
MEWRIVSMCWPGQAQPEAAAAVLSGVLPGRSQQRRHFLMNQIDRLQRANHYLEFDDPPSLVPLQHVNAVYRDAVDFDLELEYRTVIVVDLANVTKRIVKEHVERGAEI